MALPIVADDVYVRLGGHGDSAEGMKDRVVDDIINQELLYQKAVKLGLDKDEKYQSSVRLFERRVIAYKRSEMSRRVRNTQIASKVNVTDQDIRDYYDKHAEEITTDLRLFVLQFSRKRTRKNRWTEFRQGRLLKKSLPENFPHATRGKNPWDRGFLSWNEIPNDLLDAVYRLKKGDVSDVVNTGKCRYLP